MDQKPKLRLKGVIVTSIICTLFFVIAINAHGNVFLTTPQTSFTSNQTTDNMISNEIISQNNNTIANLSDVKIIGLRHGQLLVWNSTELKWQNANSSQSTSAVANLTDVTFAGLSNGDIMQYNLTTQKWENTRLIMTVQQIIDAYSNMAYKPSWDGSIMQLINNWGNSTGLINSQQPYNYLVYTDGVNYYAKNGTDGTISFNSTDAGYLISSACSQGEGLVLVKKGIYVGNSLHISSRNIRLIGEGQGTILQFSKGIMVSNTSESYHQEISNLQLIGTGYENIGLTLSAASRFISYNLIVMNYNIGIYIKSSPTGATIFNNFYSLMSHDNNFGVCIRRDLGDCTVAHNTFYGGSIVTNLQWGVVIMGSASHEIFEGVEIENNCHGQVRLSTIAPGLVPEGNTFSKCYFEPWLINPSTPFIDFTTELSPETKPWGNIFKENKFAVVGNTTITLPTSSVFVNNYISGTPATFTIDATSPGCNVEGNVNPAGVVKVNYIGTGNTGRIMQYSRTNLVASSNWVSFGVNFPKGPTVLVSVTGNGAVISAWAYQIETTRFYLVMFYSNGTEVKTPQYVTWTASLNLQ